MHVNLRYVKSTKQRSIQYSVIKCFSFTWWTEKCFNGWWMYILKSKEKRLMGLANDETINSWRWYYSFLQHIQVGVSCNFNSFVFIACLRYFYGLMYSCYMRIHTRSLRIKLCIINNDPTFAKFEYHHNYR